MPAVATAVREMKPAPGPRSVPQTESINPEKAREYLNTMVRNRPISPTRVVDFALQMDEGKWVLNGETIKFDAKGNLIDGQHRLEACILAGKPFISLVVRGIEDERAFTTIDVGKTRTHGDIFNLVGFQDQNNAAATAALLYYWKNDLLKSLPGPHSQSVGKLKKMTAGTQYSVVHGRKSIPKEELLEFVDNRRLREKIVDALKVVDEIHCSKLMPRSMAATCLILFSEKDHVEARVFMKHVAEGEGLTKNDPAYVLREKLLDLKSDKHARVNRFAVLLMIFKAWNAHRSKEKIKRITIGEDEKFPKIA